MNRYVDAIQYGATLRQIAADQANSLKQAQQSRDQRSDAAQQSRRLQNELRDVHIEAYKERHQHFMDKRAGEYYASDMQRKQDHKDKVKASYDDHTEDLVAKADDREFNADLKKRQMRISERYWAAVERERSDRSLSGASSHRVHVLDTTRKQLEQTRLKKVEHMENFAAAVERRKGHVLAANISKEIQRTQGRMMHLQGDKQAWKAACRFGEIMEPELIIEDKFREEAARLARLDYELRETQAPQHDQIPVACRRRPRSAMAIRPRTGGITTYSADTPKRHAEIYFDATALGPRISVVGHQISTGGCLSRA